MVDSALRTLIERTNPWLGKPDALPALAARYLPARPIARSVASTLSRSLASTSRAHLVVGPRQAGKSTAIWSILASNPGHVLHLNCEEHLIREWCRSPGLFAGDLADWLPPGGTLFLEEAQWLDDAGLFLKGLVDARAGCRIAVTGSASFHLLARTRESLAGRATYHHVFPLSLAEVAPTAGSTVPAQHRREAREALERHLVFGGYPEAWTAEDPRPVLDDLVTAFVLRDASDRFHIARPDAFRLLLRLIAGQVGDLVSYSEWSRVLGIAATTVADYVALMEETHVLRCVRPFIGGRRAELTQAPKAYFIDNGLRNAVAGGFEALDRRIDIGKLLEGWVFSELHKRWPEPGAVRYWRTRAGAEVDFVLEPEPGRLVAVEVKASGGRRPGITRSLASFVEAYSPSLVMFVHRGDAHVEAMGSTEVRWIAAELLPEALAEVAR